MKTDNRYTFYIRCDRRSVEIFAWDETLAALQDSPSLSLSLFLSLSEMSCEQWENHIYEFPKTERFSRWEISTHCQFSYVADVCLGTNSETKNQNEEERYARRSRNAVSLEIRCFTRFFNAGADRPLHSDSVNIYVLHFCGKIWDPRALPQNFQIFSSSRAAVAYIDTKNVQSFMIDTIHTDANIVCPLPLHLW